MRPKRPCWACPRRRWKPRERSAAKLPRPWRGVPWRNRKPISLCRSPASLGRAAAHRESRSALCISPPRRAAAGLSIMSGGSATSAAPRCTMRRSWRRSPSCTNWRGRRHRRHPRRDLREVTPIDLVRAPLEGGGEAAEGEIEHAAHEQAERAALELVGDEERDLAGALPGRAECPAVLHPTERPFEILHQDLQLQSVERHAAGERFAHELVGYRHVGDQN